MSKEYIEIIRFFSVKAMSDMNAMISDLNGSDIEEISKKFSLSAEMAKKLQDDFIVNGIVPASSFVGDAAKAAFDELGLGMNANINMELKEGILATINAHIRSTLANSKYVDYVSSKSAIEAEKSKVRTLLLTNYGNRQPYQLNSTELAQYNKDATILLKAIDDRYNFEDSHFALFRFNSDAFDNVGTQKDPILEYENAFRAINKLQYLTDSFSRPLPSFEATTDNGTMIRSTYEITEDVKEFINEQGKVKWTFKSSMEEMYNEYMHLKINRTKGDIEHEQYIKFLEANGYVRIDTNKIHVSEAKKIRSVNDKMIRELDTLMSVYGNNKFREEGFYLQWGQPVNGRAMIENELQPQESKVVRSYIEQVAPEGSDFFGHSYVYQIFSLLH
jgi:hypothetical protein